MLRDLYDVLFVHEGLVKRGLLNVKISFCDLCNFLI
jgi:hypothetical protein